MSAFFLANSLQKMRRNETDHQQPLEITNLQYCSGEKLDLFVPQSDSPVPLVIYIHGGGWRYGSKVGGSEKLFTSLVEEGIAVASINYRLSDNAKFPAAVQDTLCAVRFLKSQATIFNIDKNKIALTGISAGAHLAALSANSSTNDIFVNDQYSNYSSEVKAAVLINGIYDLNNPDLKVETKENISYFIKDTSAGSLRSASPIESLNKDSPAQIIVYSSGDKLVSPTQSKNYYQKAKKVGADLQVVEVSRADHNLNPWLSTVSRPSKKVIQEEIRKFLKDKLN